MRIARTRASKQPASAPVRKDQQQRRTVVIQIIAIVAILILMSIVKYWH
jgi:hypothetical protein